jgi:hypothetical protein
MQMQCNAPKSSVAESNKANAGERKPWMMDRSLATGCTIRFDSSFSLFHPPTYYIVIQSVVLQIEEHIATNCKTSTQVQQGQQGTKAS